MASFLQHAAKSVLKTGTVADEGCVGDIAGWIDTGSYTLNALVSASLYKGFPSNKITGLSGKSGVGKTYFAIQSAKSFLDAHQDNSVVYFDSEAAITTKMLSERGVDTSRISVVGVATIEEFRTKAVQTIKEYANFMSDLSEPRLLIVLDSMGQLSSNKETEDIESGSDKRDMTKSQLLKGAFRALTLLSGEKNVPILLTNHVYDSIGGMFPTTNQAGGTGMVYAASTILVLGKSKEKDGTDVVGAIIRAKTEKSRLSKEQQVVKTLLNFKTGLDKWYGMIEFAEASGAFKKVGTRYEIGDKKVFGKHIMNDPETYFTPDVMEKIEAWVNKEFSYGSSQNTLELVDEVVEDE